MNPEFIQLARQHQRNGLKTLKDVQKKLEKLITWSEQSLGGSDDVPGDIHGTTEGLQRRVIPHLLNAAQSYMAACWARNEALSGTRWPCSAHREKGEVAGI